MNWTGGRLQRHSRSKVVDVTRCQKRYFARARAKTHDHESLLSTSNFSPSFLQLGKTVLSREKSSTDRLIIASAQSQPDNYRNYSLSKPCKRKKKYPRHIHSEISLGVNSKAYLASGYMDTTFVTRLIPPKHAERSVQNPPEDSKALWNDNPRNNNQNERFLGVKCANNKKLKRDQQELLQDHDWLRLKPVLQYQMNSTRRSPRPVDAEKRTEMIKDGFMHLLLPARGSALLEPDQDQINRSTGFHPHHEPFVDPIRVRIGTDALRSETSESSQSFERTSHANACYEGSSAISNRSRNETLAHINVSGTKTTQSSVEPCNTKLAGNNSELNAMPYKLNRQGTTIETNGTFTFDKSSLNKAVNESEFSLSPSAKLCFQLQSTWGLKSQEADKMMSCMRRECCSNLPRQEDHMVSLFQSTDDLKLHLGAVNLTCQNSHQDISRDATNHHNTPPVENEQDGLLDDFPASYAVQQVNMEPLNIGHRRDFTDKESCSVSQVMFAESELYLTRILSALLSAN
jgi:hypothetical protein